MKIHGTAKGGALSKKDFGVAFSKAAEPGGVWYNTLEVEDQTENSVRTGSYIYRGEGVHNSSSTMIGKTITVGVVPLRDISVSAGLTGTVYLRIYNASDELQETIGSLDATTITTTKTNYTFSGSGSHALEDGDFVMINYDGGSSKHLGVYQSDEQAYDGQNSRRAYGLEAGVMVNSGSTTDFIASFSDE